MREHANAMTERAAEPRFGAVAKALFPLDEAAVYLNHGTVGVTPKAVAAAQQAWRERIERHPAREMLRALKPRLRAAAARLGERLGVPGEELVFVGNATEGVNAVLRSVPLKPGDAILMTDHTYGGVANAVRHIARSAGAAVEVARIPFPVADEAQVVEAIAAAMTPRTRLALIDHITSETALLMPLERIARLCRERGILLLVDGAHAPGQIALDLPATGADWYVGNLHKWMFVPRSCGVLWAPKPRQDGLHPTVISWGLDKGMAEEFDWTGTRDPSAALSIGAALDFIDRFGGLSAIHDYIHPLARAAAARLMDRWHGPRHAPASMTAAMALAALPPVATPDKPTADRLRELLLERHDIEVPVIPRAGRLWFRLSLQIYNEMADIDRLAEATEALASAEGL